MTDEQQANYGKTLLNWEVADYPAHARGTAWYIGVMGVGLALLIWALATRSFLFAFLLIIVAVIMATHALHPPRQYAFAIVERGIILGRKFYPWKDLERFWIVYEPPEVKTLYLEFGGLRPRLPVPLGNTDPNRVRALLKDLIAEDTSKTEEPLSDWFARVLKI